MSQTSGDTDEAARGSHLLDHCATAHPPGCGCRLCRRAGGWVAWWLSVLVVGCAGGWVYWWVGSLVVGCAGGGVAWWLGVLVGG